MCNFPILQIVLIQSRSDYWRTKYHTNLNAEQADLNTDKLFFSFRLYLQPLSHVPIQIWLYGPFYKYAKRTTWHSYTQVLFIKTIIQICLYFGSSDNHTIFIKLVPKEEEEKVRIDLYAFHSSCFNEKGKTQKNF